MSQAFAMFSTTVVWSSHKHCYIPQDSSAQTRQGKSHIVRSHRKSLRHCLYYAMGMHGNAKLWPSKKSLSHSASLNLLCKSPLYCKYIGFWGLICKKLSQFLSLSLVETWHMDINPCRWVWVCCENDWQVTSKILSGFAFQVNQLNMAKKKAQRTAQEKSRVAETLEVECKGLKNRLHHFLHDQRKLIVQLGLTQQKAGIRGVIGGPEEAAMMALFQPQQGSWSSPKANSYYSLLWPGKGNFKM